MTAERPFLSEIWVYPVKSLGGIRLEAAQVQERGLQYDRRWLIVDENDSFLTQRVNPKMATIAVSIGENELVLSDQNNAADFTTVPFNPDTSPELTVRIWKDHALARTVSEQADTWLSGQLGRTVRIVELAENAERLSPDLSGHARSLVSFADDFPFLLATEASLQDLNSRLPEPVSMKRFRPNFVIGGTAAFAEDTWQSVRISGIAFDLISPCERCVVVTIDQETGAKGLEPLRTLAKYRRTDRKILFGQNAVGRGTGIVRVGDAVEIIA